MSYTTGTNIWTLSIATPSYVIIVQLACREYAEWARVRPDRWSAMIGGRTGGTCNGGRGLHFQCNYRRAGWYMNMGLVWRLWCVGLS